MIKVKSRNKRILQQKGITLVSLVITIILIIILTGITISEFTGHGLFAKAIEARENSEMARLEEEMKLAITETLANKDGESITLEDYKETLSGKDLAITDQYEEDGKLIITVDDKYVFEITDDNGNIDVEGIGMKGKLPPKLTLSNITNTTNSITVEVTTKRNEGGKIEYYIKAKDEEEYVLKETQTDETYKYTYTGLEQNKKYNIKIVAIAENKQTDEVLVDRITGMVPDLVDADITFTYSPTQETWTNGSVTITASANKDITGYTLKLSTDLKTWSESVTRTENGVVYAKLSDDTNQYGEKYATGNVTNIDILAPKVFTPTAESTTNSITVTASAEDADATDASGKSGISGYRFKLDSGSWTEYQTSGIYTWDSLTQTTLHTITVEAKDNAGNTKQATVDKGTDTVTSGLTKGAISFGTATWNDGKATVTISTNTDFAIQYQKNSVTGTWIIGTSVTNLTHNDIVYARLIDETGQTGNSGTDTSNYASIYIVDGVKPTIGSVTGSTTTGNTGIISVNNIEDTGGSGLTGIYISNVNTSTAPTLSSIWISNISNSYSKSVTLNGTYYVWVKDNAGNISSVSSCTVSGIVEKVKISSYSDSSVIAGETVTPTLSYTGTPKTKTFSSSDTSIGTVDSNGVVTGISVGKVTITAKLTNYDGTTETVSCIVSVSEYLQYYGDLKISKTGGFTLYRNYENEIYDDQNTTNGLYASVNNAGYAAAYISNNSVDLTKVSQLVFNYSIHNNYSGLRTYLSVGVANNRNVDDYWLTNNAVDKYISQIYQAETGNIYVDVSGVNNGLLKIFMYHGYESECNTMWCTIRYILAIP